MTTEETNLFAIVVSSNESTRTFNHLLIDDNIHFVNKYLIALRAISHLRFCRQPTLKWRHISVWHTTRQITCFIDGRSDTNTLRWCFFPCFQKSRSSYICISGMSVEYYVISYYSTYIYVYYKIVCEKVDVLNIQCEKKLNGYHMFFSWFKLYTHCILFFSFSFGLSRAVWRDLAIS